MRDNIYRDGCVECARASSANDFRIDLISKIKKIMLWDDRKAYEWYYASNPLCGGASPFWMVTSGRGYQVLSFISEAEDK